MPVRGAWIVGLKMSVRRYKKWLVGTKKADARKTRVRRPHCDFSASADFIALSFAAEPVRLQREEEGDDQEGNDHHNHLERDAYTHIVGEGISAGRHHHSVGRRADRCGKDRTCGHGSRHHKGVGVYAQFCGCFPSDRGYQDSRSRIA